MRKPGRTSDHRAHRGRHGGRSGLATALGVGLLTVGLAACESGPPDVTVVGTDYAFELPETLAPGLTSFAFENRGQVDHEMILVRLKEGVTLERVMEVEESGDDLDTVLEPGAGILIAGPGERAATRLLADLDAGATYALVCNFRDAPEAPPHTALGMTASFTVE